MIYQMPSIMSKVQPTRRRLQFDEEDDDESGTENANIVQNIQNEIEETASQNFANTYLEYLRQHQDEMKRKYNFDFANESPLPGPYQWEPVRPEDIDRGVAPVVVEAPVMASTNETQQNTQQNNDQNEAMDCDSTSSNRDKPSVMDQFVTPTKNTE